MGESATPFTTAPPRNVDWDLARLTRANVLLVGSEPTISDLIVGIWSFLDGPIRVRRADERLTLGSPSQPIGTLIVHGANTLSEGEQQDLHDWLTTRTGRTRVITTAPASLLPLVRSHRFSGALYYRLNTIGIDVSSR